MCCQNSMSLMSSSGASSRLTPVGVAGPSGVAAIVPSPPGLSTRFQSAGFVRVAEVDDGAEPDSRAWVQPVSVTKRRSAALGRRLRSRSCCRTGGRPTKVLVLKSLPKSLLCWLLIVLTEVVVPASTEHYPRNSAPDTRSRSKKVAATQAPGGGPTRSLAAEFVRNPVSRIALADKGSRSDHRSAGPRRRIARPRPDTRASPAGIAVRGEIRPSRGRFAKTPASGTKAGQAPSRCSSRVLSDVNPRWSATTYAAPGYPAPGGRPRGPVVGRWPRPNSISALRCFCSTCVFTTDTITGSRS